MTAERNQEKLSIQEMLEDASDTERTEWAHSRVCMEIHKLFLEASLDKGVDLKRAKAEQEDSYGVGYELFDEDAIAYNLVQYFAQLNRRMVVTLVPLVDAEG